MRKGEIALLQAISPFLTMFSMSLVCQNAALFGNGLSSCHTVLRSPMGKTFENMVGKGENAGNHCFSLFVRLILKHIYTRGQNNINYEGIVVPIVDSVNFCEQ